MPAGARFALWAPSGHTLYVAGSAGVEAWTPEGGAAAVPSTPPWTVGPNFGPDGTQVAFTTVDSKRNVRAHVYGLAAKADRLLSSKPRSIALFIKIGWLWYLEESTCVDSPDRTPCFGDPTSPDGVVLAMNLTTGAESRVAFADGEAPFASSYPYIYPEGLWPVSS